MLRQKSKSDQEISELKNEVKQLKIEVCRVYLEIVKFQHLVIVWLFDKDVFRFTFQKMQNPLGQRVRELEVYLSHTYINRSSLRQLRSFAIEVWFLSDHMN